VERRVERVSGVCGAGVGVGLADRLRPLHRVCGVGWHAGLLCASTLRGLVVYELSLSWRAGVDGVRVYEASLGGRLVVSSLEVLRDHAGREFDRLDGPFRGVRSVAYYPHFLHRAVWLPGLRRRTLALVLVCSMNRHAYHNEETGNQMETLVVGLELGDGRVPASAPVLWEPGSDMAAPLKHAPSSLNFVPLSLKMVDPGRADHYMACHQYGGAAVKSLFVAAGERAEEQEQIAYHGELLSLHHMGDAFPLGMVRQASTSLTSRSDAYAVLVSQAAPVCLLLPVSDGRLVRGKLGAIHLSSMLSASVSDQSAPQWSLFGGPRAWVGDYRELMREHLRMVSSRSRWNKAMRGVESEDVSADGVLEVCRQFPVSPVLGLCVWRGRVAWIGRGVPFVPVVFRVVEGDTAGATFWKDVRAAAERKVARDQAGGQSGK